MGRGGCKVYMGLENVHEREKFGDGSERRMGGSDGVHH